MSGIGLVARADLRRRWAATIAVAVLVGLVGAVVLSCLAGARRTNSALDRFNTYSRSANLEVTPGRATQAQLDEFARTPGVAALAVLRLYALRPTNAPQFLAIGVPVDRAMNNAIDRPRLVAGRLADPNNADELDVGESIAQLAHLHIGGTLNLQSWTQPTINRIFNSGNFTPPDGPTLGLHIVGIVRRPLDLGARSAAGGVTVLTPEFNAKYGNKIGTFNGYALRVRTATPADLPRVSQQAQAIFGRLPGFEIQTLSVDNSGANDAIRVLSAVVLIFAAVAAVAGFAAVAIVLNRELRSASAAQPTLLALGLTRRKRFAAAMVRVGIVALAGTVVAVVGALLLSPLFPFGVARRADPDPGLHADWLILAAGGLVVLIGIAALGALAAWRVTASERAPRGARRPNFITRTATVGGSSSLPVSVGLRMATDPGRGDRSVPVRSAFVAAAFAVAGLTAVGVFAASLNRLATTPPRYGATFDFHVETTGDAHCDRNDYGIKALPGIENLAAICTENIQVGDHATVGWGAQTLRGTTGPAVVAGHAPATAGEVALGASTLEALHKHIGDTVTASSPTGHGDYRIVGTVAFPQLGDAQALADGAWFTQAGFSVAVPPAKEAKNNNTSRYLVGTFAPNADRAALTARISHATLDLTSGEPSTVGGPVQPVEVSRLRQTNWFPGAVAALLALLALAAVGHALISGTRQRRRELALLKTLGFARSQVRWSVACEATTMAVVGLVIGIPLGLLAGVAIWRAVADSVGVQNSALIPVYLAALVPLVVLALNAVAYFPARRAARIRPAVALRSE
jgi:hypothetical protein